MRITSNVTYPTVTDVHLTDEEHGARDLYESLMARGHLTQDEAERATRAQHDPYVTDYRFWDWLTGRDVAAPTTRVSHASLDDIVEDLRDEGKLT